MVTLRKAYFSWLDFVFIY